MKYYAHYGHKDFTLSLGYKGDAIKDYFLNYSECISNDFVLSEGGGNIQLLNRDIQDWKITFVDTGMTANIGQRLKAVAEHLDGEEIFLANYSDGLTDLPLPQFIEEFRKQDKIASFLCIRPSQGFHVVSMKDESGLVAGIQEMSRSGIWINGGYFIFRKDIFDYIHEGEEIVQEPFQRLIDQEELVAYPYEGFWACMDTFKDKQRLDDLYARGSAPWEVWKTHSKGRMRLSVAQFEASDVRSPSPKAIRSRVSGAGSPEYQRRQETEICSHWDPTGSETRLSGSSAWVPTAMT